MGFTRDEWVTALARRMGEAKARSYVRTLFAGPDPVEAGFGVPGEVHLNAETYALLALVSTDCRRRVAEQLATAPAGLRAEAERLIRTYAEPPRAGWRRLWPFRQR